MGARVDDGQLRGFLPGLPTLDPRMSGLHDEGGGSPSVSVRTLT
jgi:hypothetical protein